MFASPPSRSRDSGNVLRRSKNRTLKHALELPTHGNGLLKSPRSSRSSRKNSNSPRQSVHRLRLDDISSEKVNEELKFFLERAEGSTVKAWIKHFDRDNDSSVTLHEFITGMQTLGYQGDAIALYKKLVDDGSNSLSLEEIDPLQAELWRRFRVWCVNRFECVEDVLATLATPVDEQATEPRWKRGVSDDQHQRDKQAICVLIPLDQFSMALSMNGWGNAEEGLIHSVLDICGNGKIYAENLRWLTVEFERQEKKISAKEKASNQCQLKHQQRKATQVTLEGFKNFLRRRYGGFISAWRNGLSPHGAHFLPKTQFFKACAKIGWRSDVRLLWNALDKDVSGCITIDELDLQSAEKLAKMQEFIQDKFGDTASTFQAFDRHRQRKLRQHEFEEQMRNHGFYGPTRDLFHGLDKGQKGFIVQQDLAFFDSWRPLPFMLAKANHQASEEVKALLLRSFRSYLKAWRRILDKDSTNRCTWYEFKLACHRINYAGDIAGAWRALDADLSGYISLCEFDPASSKFLTTFKLWADREFGSVKSAFTVFDQDGSNEVSCGEFCRSCRIYGFGGDTKSLFKALDTERSGQLQISQVAFLDEWDAEARGEFEDGVIDEFDEEKGLVMKTDSQHSLVTRKQQTYKEARGSAFGRVAAEVRTSDNAGQKQRFWKNAMQHGYHDGFGHSAGLRKSQEPEQPPHEEREEEGQLWIYDPVNASTMDILAEPHMDGGRTEHRMHPGETFRVAEEVADMEEGPDEETVVVTYLRLVDGRGWLFDVQPGVGELCKPVLQESGDDQESAFAAEDSDGAGAVVQFNAHESDQEASPPQTARQKLPAIQQTELPLLSSLGRAEKLYSTVPSGCSSFLRPALKTSRVWFWASPPHEADGTAVKRPAEALPTVDPAFRLPHPTAPPTVTGGDVDGCDAGDEGKGVYMPTLDDLLDAPRLATAFSWSKKARRKDFQPPAWVQLEQRTIASRC